MTRPIAVALVDDHAVVTRGLMAELEAASSKVEVVSVARTVPDLLEGRSGEPGINVVVLDLGLQDDSTPGDNVRAILATGARVLLFSAHADGALVMDAVRAGASGFLTKDREVEDVVQAIRDVAAGDEAITAEMLRALSSAPGERPSLSAQQQTVLVMYTSTDLKLTTIARQLDIKPETLKTHLRRIKEKYATLGRPAHTRLELYRRALEDGFVED